MQWEYHWLDLNRTVQGDQLQAMLNELGADGWELVSVVGTTIQMTAFFKRLRS